MLNRKGYSLIELMVCIAMIAILSTVSVSVLGYLRLANVDKCAKEVNSQMESARLATMSKSGSPFVYIYKTDDGVYFKLSTEDTLTRSGGKRMGASNISVYFTMKNGTEEELTSSNEIKFQFTKDTGAFTSANGGKIYDNIRFASKKGTQYTIKFIEKTGKHYVK